MKIALYIEDGYEQIVLTPQTETEKNILNKIRDNDRKFSIKKGSFYYCQGGWVRQSDRRDDESTIFVLNEKQSTEDPS